MMSETDAASLSRLGSQKGQRTALDAEALAQSFLNNLFFVQGRSLERATVNDLYMALAHTVRDRILERWLATIRNYQTQDVRVVCYLSAEFLTGPHLANNLINLGIYDETEQAMRQLGIDLNVLIEQEEEPGLGNGGWAGLLPVSWILWPHWKFLRLAMGSVMSTASSISRFGTVGRSSRPTSGCALEIPGLWNVRRMDSK